MLPLSTQTSSQLTNSTTRVQQQHKYHVSWSLLYPYIVAFIKSLFGYMIGSVELQSVFHDISLFSEFHSFALYFLQPFPLILRGQAAKKIVKCFHSFALRLIC